MKRSFALDRETRERIPKRVLQCEPDDHGADGGGGQQLVMKHERGHEQEQTDDDEVLQDRRIAIGNPIVSERIQKRNDDEVDQTRGERQPLDRNQLFVDRVVRRKAERQDDVQDDVHAEEEQRELQLPADQAIDREPKNNQRRCQRGNAEH